MDLSKLNSDRLWALLLFIAVIAANAVFDMGITQEKLELLSYAVIAFILGKSVRGTGMQSVIDLVVGGLSQAAKAIPEVPADEEPNGS